MIPAAAVEAAALAAFSATNHLQWDDIHETDRRLNRLVARAALEAAAPHMERTSAAEMASIIREHWAAEVPHPMYPTYVQCMKHGCDWDGRFLGDISEHVAELIALRLTP